MTDFIGLVAYGHLVQHNAEGPHVYSGTDLNAVGHLRRLIVLRAHAPFHESQLTLRFEEMAEAEVADFRDRLVIF